MMEETISNYFINHFIIINIPYRFFNNTDIWFFYWRNFAKTYKVNINLGSLLLKVKKNRKLVNQSILINKYGKIQSTYNIQMPHGIAINDKGKIFICAYRKNSIVSIENNDIKIIKSSKFDYPLSMAIRDSYTIIANYGNENSGNLIYSNDELNTFGNFTKEWTESKPHSVRFNKKGEIVVVYRFTPGIVIYNENGDLITQKKLSDNFDPLAIIEYKTNYLVPNYIDGQIYLFDSLLNNLGKFVGGGYSPTNLAIWNDRLYICEEKANRVLYVNLEEIDNILNLFWFDKSLYIGLWLW